MIVLICFSYCYSCKKYLYIVFPFSTLSTPLPALVIRPFFFVFKSGPFWSRSERYQGMPWFFPCQFNVIWSQKETTSNSLRPVRYFKFPQLFLLVFFRVDIDRFKPPTQSLRRASVATIFFKNIDRIAGNTNRLTILWGKNAIDIHQMPK